MNVSVHIAQAEDAGFSHFKSQRRPWSPLSARELSQSKREFEVKLGIRGNEAPQRPYSPLQRDERRRANEAAAQTQGYVPWYRRMYQEGVDKRAARDAQIERWGPSAPLPEKQEHQGQGPRPPATVRGAGQGSVLARAASSSLAGPGSHQQYQQQQQTQQPQVQLQEPLSARMHPPLAAAKEAAMDVFYSPQFADLFSNAAVIAESARSVTGGRGGVRSSHGHPGAPRAELHEGGGLGADAISARGTGAGSAQRGGAGGAGGGGLRRRPQPTAEALARLDALPPAMRQAAGMQRVSAAQLKSLPPSWRADDAALTWKRRQLAACIRDGTAATLATAAAAAGPAWRGSGQGRGDDGEAEGKEEEDDSEGEDDTRDGGLAAAAAAAAAAEDGVVPRRPYAGVSKHTRRTYDPISRRHGFLCDRDLAGTLESSRFTRRGLFALWVRFKAMCALSGGTEGISRDVFKRGVSRLAIEDDLFVSSVFALVDEDGSGTIEWDEFLLAMNALERGDVETKCRFFFQVGWVQRGGSFPAVLPCIPAVWALYLSHHPSLPR